MQSNTSVIQHNDQHQPPLPSYAEAMRTASAPSNFPHSYTIDQDSFHPTASTYGPQAVPVHTQYSNQPNYSHVPFSTTGCTYPPTYATNTHPQYGQTTADLEVPTTIHIIRPVSTEYACCRGTSGRLLGVVFGLVVLGAILRVTMNSYF